MAKDDKGKATEGGHPPSPENPDHSTEHESEPLQDDPLGNDESQAQDQVQDQGQEDADYDWYSPEDRGDGLGPMPKAPEAFGSASNLTKAEIAAWQEWMDGRQKMQKAQAAADEAVAQAAKEAAKNTPEALAARAKLKEDQDAAEAKSKAKWAKRRADFGKEFAHLPSEDATQEAKQALADDLFGIAQKSVHPGLDNADKSFEADKLAKAHGFKSKAKALDAIKRAIKVYDQTREKEESGIPGGGKEGFAERSLFNGILAARRRFEPWATAIPINPDNGSVAVDEAVVRACLLNHPELTGIFAFDDFQKVIVVNRRPPWEAGTGEWEPREIQDGDATAALIYFQDGLKHGVYHGIITRGIEAAATACRFDPLLDYFDAFDQPGLQWDGVDRFPELLDRMQAKPVTPLQHRLYIEQVRRWMISGVARAYVPGTKVDTILVLTSRKQGLKKSGFFSTICPFDHWHSDGIDGDLGGKDAALAVEGIFIMEFAEIDILKGRDASIAKRFASRGKDRIRRPYGRFTESLHRRGILGGSTNQYQPFHDATGGRRMMPVPVWGEIDLAWIGANCDQLWAQARVAFKAGAIWWFDPIKDADLLAAAENEQAAATEGEPWASDIDDWIEGEFDTYIDNRRAPKQASAEAPNGQMALDGIPTREARKLEVYVPTLAIHALGLSVDKRTQAAYGRIRNAMLELGWEQHQLTGKVAKTRRTVWRPKPEAN